MTMQLGGYDHWHAMIAAAPPATPAAQSFEPSVDLLVRLRATMVRLGVSTGDDGLEGFGAALGSHLYALCRALEATPAAQPADEREAFEAWISSTGRAHMLKQHPRYPGYEADIIQTCWVAWEARAALAAAPSAPTAQEKE